MTFVKTHQECPCGKSSDAYSINEDGSGKCFSCDRHYPATRKETMDTGSFTYQIVPWRGVTEATMSRYNMNTKVNDNGEPVSIGFVYPNKAVKVRQLNSKTFFVSNGKPEGLFGLDCFPDYFGPVIITEGELDAASAYQMTGIPAFSVSSASAAHRDVSTAYERLSKCSRVYLAFDADEPGKRATASVAPMFDFNKVFKIDMGLHKDPNGYLLNDNSKEFRDLYHRATRFVPDGVISEYSEVEEALKEGARKPVCDVPISALQEKLEGFGLGESVLWSGLEGIGKTEILRLMEHHVLRTTDYNVGIIHIEEKKRDTISNLLTYELEVPLKKKGTEVPREELMEHYKSLTRRDGRAFIYSHFGSDDPDSLLGIVRYLVAVCGCKFVFFDHINILVSGMGGERDERKTLDYICTKLAEMVVELDFNLQFICHENDDGRPRGSRNISQTAHVHVRLSRNTQEESEFERSKLYLIVAKNRPAGPTGPCGFVYYDSEKGVLKDGSVSFMIPQES